MKLPSPTRDEGRDLVCPGICSASVSGNGTRHCEGSCVSGSHGSMPYPGPYCRHLDWAIGARFVVDRAHARPLGP